MTDFKKRIAEQKAKDERKKYEMYHKDFKVKGLEVNVDCNNTYIDQEELEMTIDDILATTKGTTIERGKVFKLDEVADLNFDLVFKGSAENKLYFKVA